MGGVTNVLKQAGGAVGDVLTLGTSHIKGSPTGKVGKGLGTVFSGGLGTKGDASNIWNGGSSGNPDTAPLAQAPGGQSPTELLAQTGGAPVLASVAMGVSPKAALANFMGVEEANFDDYISNLNPKDAASLHSTLNTLTSIQSNTELRNRAVQSVINDFPNVTAKIAQDRASSGQEFDSVTQGYMKQALDQTAAKYAANGGLSSGAANEAFAKTGAGLAMNKLDYMGQREAVSAQQHMTDLNARLGEVNALRDFQQTMLGQGAQQGFSAAQANLGRIQQGGLANMNYANQRSMADLNSNNAMLGSIGSLAGTAIGAYFGGPMGAAAGASVGGSVMGGSFNQNAPKVYNTSYGRTLGGY